MALRVKNGLYSGMTIDGLKIMDYQIMRNNVTKERLEVGFFSLQIRSYLQKSNFNG